MGSTTVLNNSEKESELGREKKSGEEMGREGEARRERGFSCASVFGLCVYSSAVFPSSPLPLVTAHYRFWEEAVILSSPCTWAPQMQSPYHLDVTCIWHLAWIRCSIKVCGLINITFLLARKKMILPPAFKRKILSCPDNSFLATTENDPWNE